MDDNRNDQIAAASWNGDAPALPAADDAIRTLERVKALLGVGLPVLDLQALWEAMAEIEALEARREAGRDG